METRQFLAAIRLADNEEQTVIVVSKPSGTFAMIVPMTNT
jgi:hypothetical protein